ncbi:MAG: peptide synthetase, partial [Saprospiraceae bacterium]|nr:peptide synthetase [Saprospiraceae bacterium]
MINNRFSCFLIGQTIVLSECGDILIRNNFQILGVFTDSSETIMWCQLKKIKVYPITGNIHSVLIDKKFDFLFSIVNKIILPEEILSLPKIKAINYHDAPLPKYAGVNANTWAIIQQEKTYGITWHEMVEKLDAGVIIEQPIFEIDNNDTVIDLNIKCNKAAIKSFIKLVDKLIHDRLQYKTQNLAKRSYVAKNKKPIAGAVFQWDNTAEEIYALFRSLHFY